MPPEPWIVRPAGRADLDAIVDCQSACWSEAYTGLVDDEYLISPEVRERRRDRWSVRLDDGTTVRVGVLASGEMVGVARASEEELDSLYVRGTCQRSGLGSALLRAVLGDRPAHLWVFAANEQAQQFYRRHGFVPDGRTDVDPDTGLPGLRMSRPEVSAG